VELDGPLVLSSSMGGGRGRSRSPPRPVFPTLRPGPIAGESARFCRAPVRDRLMAATHMRAATGFFSTAWPLVPPNRPHGSVRYRKDSSQEPENNAVQDQVRPRTVRRPAIGIGVPRTRCLSLGPRSRLIPPARFAAPLRSRPSRGPPALRSHGGDPAHGPSSTGSLEQVGGGPGSSMEMARAGWMRSSESSGPSSLTPILAPLREPTPLNGAFRPSPVEAPGGHLRIYPLAVAKDAVSMAPGPRAG